MNKTVAVVVHGGNTYYFKGQIGYAQLKVVERLCTAVYRQYMSEESWSVKGFCDAFIAIVKKELGIKLTQVQIDYVIRPTM